MSKDNNDLSQIFGEIRDAISGLNKKIDKQNERLAQLEEGFSTKKEIAVRDDVSEAFKNQEKVLSEERVEKIKEVKFKERGLSDEFQYFPPGPPRPPQTSPKAENLGNLNPIYKKTGEVKDLSVDKVARNLEEEIGARWFAKIGMVILFLGISFFMKYAFDHDWVTETGRVVLGVIAGIILLGIGEATIRKYPLYGKVTSAGGLGVLYLSAYASYNFYHLLPLAAAFLFMALVTAVGIFISFRYDCQKLLIGALLGGFFTPFLIQSGSNNQIGLLAYIALLDVGVLIVSFLKKWRWANLAGFVGTIMVFGDWYDKFYTKEQLLSTMLFLTFFFLIYSVSALAYNLIKKEKSGGVEQAMSLFAGIIFFNSGYFLMNPSIHFLMGFFALLIAVYYGLLAYLVKVLTPKDENLYSFLAFLSMSFVSLAIPIQFSEYIITIGWTIEAVLLLILASRLSGKPKRFITYFGFAIFTLALIRALVIDSMYYTEKSYLFFNKVFLSSFFIIAGSYFIVYAYKKLKKEVLSHDGIEASRVISVFLVVASIVTMFAVTRELDVYHGNLVKKEYNKISVESIGTKKANEYTKYNNLSPDSNKIKNINERKAFLIILFSLIYSILVIYLSAKGKESFLFIGANIIILFIALKTFLYEMWRLDTYYRFFTVLSVILSCYLAAFILNKYKAFMSDKRKDSSKKIFIIFLLSANILSIFFGSKEISRYYEKKITILRNETSQICSANNSSVKLNNVPDVMSRKYDTKQCAEYRNRLKVLMNMASVAISIFWLLYAVILLVFGFVKSFKWVRVGGLALLIVSILKLFFYDLWSLGQLYRIISSISLGVVLLLISFAYNKYKDRFKEMI